MVRSRRLVVRFSARIRREGGSLSITIPRYLVRNWKLEPGQWLVLRTSEEGIVLRPRYLTHDMELQFTRSRSGARLTD